MSLFYAVSALRVSGARIGALRGVGKAEKSGETAGKAIQFQIQISNFEMAGQGGDSFTKFSCLYPPDPHDLPCLHIPLSATATDHSSKRRNARQTLCPPKPKEFEMATRTGCAMLRLCA